MKLCAEFRCSIARFQEISLEPQRTLFLLNVDRKGKIRVDGRDTKGKLRSDGLENGERITDAGTWRRKRRKGDWVRVYTERERERESERER